MDKDKETTSQEIEFLIKYFSALDFNYHLTEMISFLNDLISSKWKHFKKK